MTPIKIEQTTLNKYLSGLKINPLATDENCSDSDSIDNSYTIIIVSMRSSKDKNL